mgnify:CR=1 FL=1
MGLRETFFGWRWRAISWKRAIASFFVLYHLTAILIGPSPMGYFHQALLPVFHPYWAALEFGSTWSFFAPEPGSPPTFLEWEAEDEKGVRSTGRFPAFPSPFWNRERQTLRLSIVGYIFMNEGATERAMLPYLCRTLPQAQSNSLWRTIYGVPPLKPFAEGTQKLGLNTQPIRQWVSHSFCERERSP